jgi:hypothetical protein
VLWSEAIDPFYRIGAAGSTAAGGKPAGFVMSLLWSGNPYLVRLDGGSIYFVYVVTGFCM